MIHNDDTSMRILCFPREASDDRTGLFTSGIVSISGSHRIALFFTGRRHAGENLAGLLLGQEAELGPPTQMCDALSRNTPKPLPVILANCLAHGRRHFVDVAENFPDQCHHVLETLGEVFHNDALSREQGLDPQARLRFHQERSGPLMQRLEDWCHEQIDEGKVEPKLRTGQGDPVYAQALAAADSVPARARDAHRQQHLRAGFEESDSQPQERDVLSDSEWHPCRRPVYEPDPHRRIVRRQSIRLPYQSPAPRGRGGASPSRVAALELSGQPVRVE